MGPLENNKNTSLDNRHNNLLTRLQRSLKGLHHRLNSASTWSFDSLLEEAPFEEAPAGLVRTNIFGITSLM